jgi:hypothetical protein
MDKNQMHTDKTNSLDLSVCIGFFYLWLKIEFEFLAILGALGILAVNPRPLLQQRRLELIQ